MSIIKQISSLPDTKIGFVNGNNYSYLSSIYLTSTDFTLTDPTDYDEYIAALENGDLTPIHDILEIEDLSQETEFHESLQNFTYITKKGNYRHKFKVSYNIDKHINLENISGASLNVIYVDCNRNLYLTNKGGSYRGFKTNRIAIDNFLFAGTDMPYFTGIDIELKDESEINKHGIVKAASWNPDNVDRLSVTIDVQFIDSDNLNFKLTRLGEEIEGLPGTSISVHDNVNGELTFAFFDNASGVYRTNTYSSQLTSGSIQILSDLYLGCINYVNTITVDITQNYVFENNDNFVFENDDNYIFD